MMMADLFLNPNEKESISSCFNNELNNGFIYFMLECTRNKLWFGKDKNMLTMSSYKKMISHDLNFFAKIYFFCACVSRDFVQPRGNDGGKK